MGLQAGLEAVAEVGTQGGAPHLPELHQVMAPSALYHAMEQGFHSELGGLFGLGTAGAPPTTRSWGENGGMHAVQRRTLKARSRRGPKRKTAKSESKLAAVCTPSRCISAKLVRSTMEKS